MTATPVEASPRPLERAPLADRQSRIRGASWVGHRCEGLLASRPAATRAVGS
jgi:hypothetical protein